MSEWTIFGERLNKQLEERGMTYREFAKKSGVSVTTICRFVNCDTVPRATELLKIANVLGVNCNYLLGVINDPYRDCLPHPKESTVAENATVQGDLISRQDAIDALDEQIRQCDKALSAFDISMKDEYAVKVERASLVAFRETLEYMPSAEPKKGEWIPENRTMDAFWVCSACKFPSEAHAANILYNFCPNCGADMRGEEDEEESGE